MIRFTFFALTILLFSCSDPIANKSNQTTFESDVAAMLESSVLTKEDARKIKCTMYLGGILEKDLSAKSYDQILSSFHDTLDDLSFTSMSKTHARSKLDSALSYELFKVQLKKLRGRVYFGFRLKNETEQTIVAYSGVITISDLFGKQIYTGPFENQRKPIASDRSREFWVKLDKSNSKIKMAMENNQVDFKWESQKVIYKGGKSLKFDEYQGEATEEFEIELRSLIKQGSAI